MKVKQKDFIEIEFTGKIKDGEIFDSNVKKSIEKADLKLKAQPFIFALGEGMFLKGVDDFLTDKEIGEYKIELTSEKAFGKRDAKLVRMIPMKMFIEHKLNPFPGATFNFDGKVAKVLTVSGGRVMVDFNHTLAGKDVVYDIKILRKVEDKNEKIKAFNEFLFKKDFKFEVKGDKLSIEVDKPLVQFVKMFEEKYKDLFNLKLDIKEMDVVIEKKKE